ncbi:MAG: metal ABC transporter substrate-binding protein [Candidatus Thorarchaeota archaeon]|nr:MAG: hypothetical protein DRO87_10460 [Candidatus Thorarchaeota archaeon]RLI56539.1 MAG: hypothetical protein DRP09_06075 [Candidatus Thorarchaeota archaeon]
MRKKRTAIFLSFIVLVPAIVLSLHAVPVDAQTQPEFTVAVSVTSLAGIVREFGGSHLNVSVLLEQEADPHVSQATPAMIATANQADLLVLTGHFHWEEDLANQTATPFVSLHGPLALMNYEDFGAALSPMPGTSGANSTGNPHAYWLLPSNAIAIANATRAALTSLNATMSDILSERFDDFVEDVQDFETLVNDLDVIYGFSEKRAVVVAPPEAYVAQAFGIECDAVLQVEDVTLNAAQLYQVQQSLRDGSIQLIIGSDVAQFQAGGEYAYQLQSDAGGILIWWRTVYFGESSDYIGLMTYNLGALTSGLEGRSGTTENGALNVLILSLVGVLGVIVVIETVILVQRARYE